MPTAIKLVDDQSERMRQYNHNKKLERKKNEDESDMEIIDIKA